MEIPTALSPKSKPVLTKKQKLPKVPKFLIIILLVLLGLGVLSFFFLYLPAQALIKEVNKTKTVAGQLQTSLADKDLNQGKQSLLNLRQQITEVDKKLNLMAYLRAIPVANNYYKDAKTLIKVGYDSLDTGDILIQAAEPYADFLGLKGAGTSSAQTTEDRINFLTQSIESILPHFDTINNKVTEIDQLLATIDISRYPETYKDIPIHQNFNKVRQLVGEFQNYVSNGKPILSKSSWLLGKDKPRNYLVIFQNDAELRPSGGFWTAYTTLKVDKGKITAGSSSNIYDLDDKISSTTPAPRLIKSYHINVPYLNLRDSNLSPDFPTDAKIFLDQYYKAMGKKTEFDAVIALDTKILVDIVKVLEKIDTQVGTFTAKEDNRCNGCPNIIYELEWIAGRPRDFILKDRKGFLGPVMHAILANAMGSEKSKLAPLASAFFTNLNEKHVLFYFTDPEIQQAAQQANIAGHIAQTPENIDYFHLNDANFASAKSNLFITQKILHEIESKNNQVQHKFTITYTNPFKASNCNLEKGDLCLNAAAYRNLFRVYTPIGSKLEKITGSEVESVQYEELGKQVFEGFFGNKYPLYASSSSKVTIEYISSIKPSKDYTLFLQKQPGTKAVEYELKVNGRSTNTFSWVADKTLKLAL